MLPTGIVTIPSERSVDFTHLMRSGPKNVPDQILEISNRSSLPSKNTSDTISFASHVKTVCPVSGRGASHVSREGGKNSRGVSASEISPDERGKEGRGSSELIICSGGDSIWDPEIISEAGNATSTDSASSQKLLYNKSDKTRLTPKHFFIFIFVQRINFVPPH